VKTGKTAASWRPEFSRPLNIAELDDGDEGRRHLTAEPDERLALCARFELVALDRLEADVSYVRRGRIVVVEGRLVADLTQTCVVTLEPLPAHLDEPFTVRFDPDLDPDSVEFDDSTAEELLEEDDVQALVGDVIDLGEVVAECLGLALDPYPRKEGSSIDPRYVTPPPGEGSESSPFAVLKKLRQ